MVNGGLSHEDSIGYIGAGRRLTALDIVRVAREYTRVDGLTTEAEHHVEASSRWIDNLVTDIEKQGAGGRVRAYYGINTGFGAQAGKAALPTEYLMKVVSRNIIASHSVGVGEYFDEDVVRAAMLMRAHALGQGYSGVRPEIIAKLIAMLNHRIYPAVPSKGSLGASGDLAPLSHLALVMCKVPTPGPTETDLELDPTSGEAFAEVGPGSAVPSMQAGPYHITENRITAKQTLWQRIAGRDAMEQVGGQIELRAKEGLALNNGATFSAAVGALTLYDSWNLMENAELALAMTVEAAQGFRDAFLPQVHEARGHPGAKVSAANVLRYLQNSQLLDPGDVDRNPERVPPQDPYSIRCAPQVLGAVREALEFVQRVIDTEQNGAVDNPLIFLDLPSERDYKTVSGGNFHGEPIAMAMDFLGIAMTELGNISERRIFKLTDPEHKDVGLESFLIAEEEGTTGLNSGFMLPQYTAASLVSDCKTLAHPDSVDSIPSSANKEDHVSMSLNAARHAREIVDNVEAVIAIEFLCAAQALNLRLSKGSKELGTGTRAALDKLREKVDYLERDRVMYPDIRTAIQLVRGGDLVAAARAAMEGDDRKS